MVVTTPWTKFRHENALSSFISPTLGATSTTENENEMRMKREKPNAKREEINSRSTHRGMAAAMGNQTPATQGGSNGGKPMTAPGATRAHKRVNVVLKQYGGINGGENTQYQSQKNNQHSVMMTATSVPNSQAEQA